MRGTQIDREFVIDPEMKAWAELKVPVVNIEAETEKFIDHHRALGKVMVDWTAAWRTWMRNAVTFRGSTHYTADELQLKKLMAQYAAEGFRRAFTHENSNMYRFEYERWRQKAVPVRDMSIVSHLVQAKRA